MPNRDRIYTLRIFACVLAPVIAVGIAMAGYFTIKGWYEDKLGEELLALENGHSYLAQAIFSSFSSGFQCVAGVEAMVLGNKAAVNATVTYGAVFNPVGFELYGKRWKTRSSEFSTLSVLPNGIFAQSYPDQFQSSYGNNLMVPTNQYYADYLRALKAKHTVVFGPQSTASGINFVIRNPIFLDRAKEKFWGFASLTVIVSALMNKTEIVSALHPYIYVIYRNLNESKSKNVRDIAVIVNNTMLRTAYDDTDQKFHSEIELPGGEIWYLYLRPKHKIISGLNKSYLAAWICAGFVASCLFCSFLYYMAYLHEEKHRAQIANEAQLDFAGYVFHEIRNPIHAISSAMELAPSDVRRWCDFHVVRNATSMIHKLLDRALDYMKTESGQMQLDDVVVSSRSVIEECISVVKSYVVGTKDFTYNISNEIPKYFRGDPLRLLQVWLNISTNACKFAKTSVALTFEMSSDMKMLIMTSKDDGDGMTADEKRSLFETFKQTSASVARKHGGTGLGLAISMNLVELMGGTIKVDSEKGVGSTFTALVPVVPCEPTDEMNSSEDSGSLSQGDDVHEIKDVQVMYVDDNDINVQMGVRIMEHYGISNVAKAVHGKEAVELWLSRVNGSEPLDVIFMDLTMPVMDGWEATKRIRQLEKEHFVEQPVRIVALTGSCLSEDRERALQCGADAFLPKPCPPSVLREELVKSIATHGMNPISRPSHRQKQKRGDQRKRGDQQNHQVQPITGDQS